MKVTDREQLGSYMARNMATQLESQLKPSHLLSFRIIVPFIVYFFLSRKHFFFTTRRRSPTT